MQVILLERIHRLGHMGETVSVKPGFARNFLLPKKKALRATEANLAYFNAQKSKLEADNATRKVEAEKLAKVIDGLKIVVLRQAGETGHLYGSVSARDIAQAVIDAGHKVERSMVDMHHPIKTIGLFDEVVHLHPEVQITVRVNVARNVDEAKVQWEKGAAVLSALALAEEEAAKAEAAALAAAPAAEETSEEAVSADDAKKAAKKSRAKKQADSEDSAA